MLSEAYVKGSLSFQGNIRHVLVDDDFSENTAWELTVEGHSRKNCYQNGAYWGTPTGWVCYAIAQIDEKLALKLAKEYIDNLREGDFRKGSEFGAPWECLHPDNNYMQNAVYLTTVTCPLAAFYKLKW